MDMKKYLVPFSGLALAACGNNVREMPNVIYVFPDQFRNQSLAFWNEDGYGDLKAEMLRRLTEIKAFFGIVGDIKIHYEHTAHYRCHLDTEWRPES